MNSVIIVAGGKGLRMGGDIPKQFMLLHTQPVLMHSIQRFWEFDSTIHIILVLPLDHQDYWRELCAQYSFTIPHTVVTGGSERFFSVRNGLQHVPRSNALIAIHDGVRPLVSVDTITRCFETAQRCGNAIPCMPAVESVRVVSASDNTNKAIDRSTVRMIQTPQTFRAEILCNAYDQEYSSLFTDDASVIESLGHRITLVDGNAENIKITTPIDLKIAMLSFDAQ